MKASTADPAKWSEKNKRLFQLISRTIYALRRASLNIYAKIFVMNLLILIDADGNQICKCIDSIEGHMSNTPSNVRNIVSKKKIIRIRYSQQQLHTFNGVNVI